MAITATGTNIIIGGARGSLITKAAAGIGTTITLGTTGTAKRPRRHATDTPRARSDPGSFASARPWVDRLLSTLARRLRLGHEIQTDVAELQLFDCDSSKAALALALALREAVARRLGIDPDEMGFAAPPARLPFEAGQSWSAVIFDRASGGAGFSSTLAEDPVGLLREARDLLDCGARGRCGDPDAEAVCPLCVMSADNQHAAEATDRRAAFVLLLEVGRRLDLPPQHKLFGADTEYESAPLAEALAGRLQAHADAHLTVQLSGAAETWDLDAWPMTPVLDRWGSRAREISVALDGAALSTADPVTRRRVALWAQRARLGIVDGSVAPGDRTLLATIVRSSGATGWASLDPEAGVIGPGWAAVSAAPIVRGPVSSPSPQDPISLDELLRERAREAVFDIDEQLNGSASGFGGRFRELLRAQSPDLADVFASPCLELRYTDRYLFSPLSVRLITELLRALADAATFVEVKTLPARGRGEARLGRRFQDDWRTMSERDLVLGALLSDAAPRSRLLCPAQVGHRRMLQFRAPRGAGVIYFDQGVGSWRTASETSFDFTREPSTQKAEIMKPIDVVNPFGTYAAVKLDAEVAAPVRAPA